MRDDANWQHLAGGSGGAWLVTAADGSKAVHRETGHWTPAVHELLRHLEDKGLPGVPRVLGFDEEGREVLTFLPGETPAPNFEPPLALLEEAARWLRKFHDAVRDFRPQTRNWRQGDLALGASQIVCHNDPGTYNWLVRGNEFVGLIDWDRAGPGKPIDDLAFLSWTGVPLLPAAEPRSEDRDAEAVRAGRRLAAVADAYGGVTAAELLEAVWDRMHLTLERWDWGISQGDPGTIALRDSGIMGRHKRALQRFAPNKRKIEAWLTEGRAQLR